jgi:prepilin-type N-terminal cleavage/methylation domain-containing protein
MRETTVGLPVKKKAGFTIVEIVVALAIMGIAVSIAIPGFSRWLPDYRLKTAATDLYANIQLTKMYAIRDGTDWSLSFNTSFDAYVFKKGDVQQTQPAGVLLARYKGGVDFGYGNATDSIPSSGSPPADVVTFPYYAVPVPHYEVTFNARGLADSEGYVYLQNSKNAAYAVGALTTGFILMRKWIGTAWE